ncbi:MAG: bis(5'-nucleosyl)-tetraphosphatase (symmetrical) YqeK [Elusimicrobia bacterium]|nr:bis(5'-nucleosyl)-tetraphosphatase (symmetrical) YqeK [Elusimicrobiota bacterium]
MRVLLFGGSFDPPHVGHAALLKAAADRIKPDRILVIPAFRAPLKRAQAAPAAGRLRLLRLGLLPLLPSRWRRVARIDTRELLSRRRVYTVETLARLKAERPDWELHFVVGSDWAAAWSEWRARKRLTKLCRWWTALRPGAPSGRIPPHFTVIRRPMPDVSSTGLRADLAAGLDCSRWLQPRAADFIARRGLYGTGLPAALKSGLKPGRFVHTLAVRRLAEALARRWGDDPRRASLAALLHDCGRLIKKRRWARYALDHGLRVPLLAQVARRQPGLLHAYVGAHLARRRFGCRERAVLRAVRNHTLGSLSMSRLERILYVADAVSEDRTHPEAAPLRRLAFRDLEAAFAAGLAAKLSHAVGRGAWLHPLSVSLWNRQCARP